ncbi:DMT family transporter [Halobacillus litoralis]|uniref:DMT family transporter n=1 Tax=Halobacillus litoralis TaxID=45668 RepID=UPI001CFDDB20|nr:EamA family transporter [Halobacillus litoralis]
MRFFGVGFVIIAAVLWGVTGGLAGILMERGWNPLVISFYRGAVGFVCLFLWFLIHPKRYAQGDCKKTILWSILAGVGVVGNFSFYFISISESGVAVASTLMYTAPVFVFMISFVFFNERATLFKIMAILVVMGGISMLTNIYAVGLSNLDFVGITTGLLSGLSYALFIISFKYACSNGRAPFLLSIAFATFTILVFPFIDQKEAFSALYSSDVVWFILLGIMGAGLSFFLYIQGLKYTSSSAASIVAMVEPVTASLFGVVVLGEVLSLIQAVGAGVILVTITWLSVRSGD